MTIQCILTEVVLVVGLIVSASIFLSVFLYTRDGAKFRPGCSILAYIILCMSVLTSIRILTGLSTGHSTYDVYELFWQGIMGTMIIINKGNISFLISDYNEDAQTNTKRHL